MTLDFLKRNGGLGRLIIFGLGLIWLAACAAEQTRDITMISDHVPNGDPARGQRVLATYGCGTCHTIPGVADADGQVGPPLNDWAGRIYIAGLLNNNPDNLIRWIQNPQEYEPGTAMPDMGVTEQDARDMAAYLYTLRRGR